MPSQLPTAVRAFDAPPEYTADLIKPCTTCRNELVHTIEVETETYREAYKIHPATNGDLLDHLQGQLPQHWISQTDHPDRDAPLQELCTFEGPIACRHQGLIQANSRIIGVRDQVYIDQVRLSPERSLEVRQHSPTGFAWGYAGSGPAQLALALLLEAGASDREATQHYQFFKMAVITPLPDAEGFVMDGQQVLDWLEKARAPRQTA